MSHADPLVLIGIAILILGFVLRFNPLLVVAASALATGLAAHLDPIAIVSAFGKAFNDARYIAAIWVVLPLIGLLERFGLQERARTMIANLRGATPGRILGIYMLMRQITAALGLVSLGGHPQTVRPLVAPMVEAAAEDGEGRLDDAEREKLKALAAGTDNIGLFFGEDIFLAIGSILLIKGFLEQYGVIVEPLHLSMWAIPTAIAAFLIHGLRLMLLDRRLKRGRGA